MYVPLKPIFFPLCLAASYYMLFQGIISDGRKANFYVHGIVKIAGILIPKKIKIYVEWAISLALQKEPSRQEDLGKLFGSIDALGLVSGNKHLLVHLFWLFSFSDSIAVIGVK